MTLEEKIKLLETENRALLDYIVGKDWKEGEPPMLTDIEVMLEGEEEGSHFMHCFSRTPWGDFDGRWRVIPVSVLQERKESPCD